MARPMLGRETVKMLKSLLLAGVAGASLTANPTVSNAAGPTDVPPSATQHAGNPTCSLGYVCTWSGINYVGTKKMFRPVPSGQCLMVEDIDSGFASVYNRSGRSIRVWELTYNSPDDGTRCAGKNKLVTPYTTNERFPFGAAQGLGGY